MYYVKAIDGISIGYWDGSRFYCADSKGSDDAIILNHYEDNYPMGVVRPLLKLTSRAIPESGVSTFVLRTMVAANKIAEIKLNGGNTDD